MYCPCELLQSTENSGQTVLESQSGDPDVSVRRTVSEGFIELLKALVVGLNHLPGSTTHPVSVKLLSDKVVSISMLEYFIVMTI